MTDKEILTAFKEKDGMLRAELIDKVKSQDMRLADQLIGMWFRERVAFIGNEEVLTDEDGEYIMATIENGTYGEDGYSVDTVREDVPDYLNVMKWLG